MEKKARSSNFSKEEELLLVQEVAKFKNEIECKITNKISNNEKEDSWKKVLINFNAKNFEVRTLSQLKSKYDNLKSKARKEIAKQRLHIRGTGGGPPIKNELDPVIEAILELINVKTVLGFSSMFDSDTIETTEDPITENSIEIFEFPEASSTSSKFLNSEDMVESIIEMPQSCSNVDAICERDHSYASGEKRTIEDDYSTPSSSKVGTYDKRQKFSSKEEKTEDWSSYVPTKLQRKTNSKLRPVVPNPICTAKKDYYLTKRELLIKAEAKEDAERDRRYKRAEEEHVKKMLLLDLDIKLKKKQLNEIN